MRGQIKIQQRKLTARKRRRVLYLTFYSLALLTLVCSGLSYLSGMEIFSLRSIYVFGNERLSSSTVMSLVLEETTGSYVGLFSKNNIILYPHDSIESGIKSLPLVQSVKINRENVRDLYVTIKEREKAAEWCMAVDLLKSSVPPCYVSDADGFIFDKRECSTRLACLESSSHKPVSETLIWRSATTTDPIGKNIISPDNFRKIKFFMNELSGLSIEPREIVLSDSSYITVVLQAGGKLIINTEDDLSSVLGNIVAVISDKKIAPSVGDFLDDLEYMKLYVGNKVVYKLRSR